MERQFKVVLECAGHKGHKKNIVYPGRGLPLYTRLEARNIMQSMQDRGCQYSTYAESDNERFTLDFELPQSHLEKNRDSS